MEIEFLELDNLIESDCQGVVIPANVELWISSRIGQEILLQAGDVIEVEALAHAPVSIGEAIVTSAGRLEQVQVIIHAVVYGGRKWFPEPLEIQQGTFSALALAHEYALESVALPILGEPTRKVSLEEIAQAMWQGLQRFLKDTPQPTVKVLKFVVEDEEILDRFFEAFAQAQEQD